MFALRRKCNGEGLDYAKEQGLDIVGVDVDPRGTNKSPQVVARIEQLPFPSESFDVVFSSNTMDSRHYDQDQLLMVKEVLRILKPGGLYLTVEGHADVRTLQGFELKDKDTKWLVLKKPLQ